MKHSLAAAGEGAEMKQRELVLCHLRMSVVSDMCCGAALVSRVSIEMAAVNGSVAVLSW